MGAVGGETDKAPQATLILFIWEKKKVRESVGEDESPVGHLEPETLQGRQVSLLPL